MSPSPLSTQELITRLTKIGMGEYEAKIYIALSTLRVATARELHEVTRIPRTRVYDTLSSLIQEGYVVLLSGRPARYHVTDITATFERIRRQTLTELEELGSGLATLAHDPENPSMRAYELHTTYAVTHQIQMILGRVKNELILLCRDPSLLNEYTPLLTAARKRAAVYLVTGRHPASGETPRTWYTGKKDLEEGIFQNNTDTDQLTIIADRRESLFIHAKNDGVEGIFIPNDPRNDYFARKILKDLISASDRHLSSPEPETPDNDHTNPKSRNTTNRKQTSIRTNNNQQRNRKQT